MVSVGAFAQFLLHRDPQTSAERIALYHFLKNARKLDETLVPAILQDFFSRALSFSHWREHSTALWEETSILLDAFGGEVQLNFTSNQLQPPQDFEIFEVKSNKKLGEVVARHLEGQISVSDQVRIMPMDDFGVCSIVLRPDLGLEVKTFDRWVSLQDGLLQPLRTDRALYYDGRLELRSDVDQSLEMSPFTTARFRSQDRRVVGFAMKGYVFARSETFDGTPLDQLGKIFFPLKRIESHFISRSSDPFYNEVTTLLEHAIQLVQQGDRESLLLGRRAYEKGLGAFEAVFRDDKILPVLLRELMDLIEKIANVAPESPSHP